MPPLNPYESPRELNDARPSALRPFYPKYRMERLVIFYSLFFGVAYAFLASLRGLLWRRWHVDEDLVLDGPITYFEPPYSDEAAWTLAGTLSFILLVVGTIRAGSTFKQGPPRTPTERWLTNAAIVVCFIPLFLTLFVGLEPGENWRFRTRILALTLGLALVGAMFHFWYWFNHRQAALLVFWVLRSTDGRWIIRQLFYRRPGRP